MIKIYHPLPDFTHLGYNFGDETSTNKLLYKRPHSGIDYNWGATARADYGKPFFAIADGVVVFEGLLPDWGRLAVIWHPDLGVWSRYGHQKTFLYKKGDVVKGGEELGKIGDGEGKFSPHLHFCVIKKELPHWGAYTKGFDKAALNLYYYNPEAYIKEMQAKRAAWEEEEAKKAAIILPGWANTNTIPWLRGVLDEPEPFIASLTIKDLKMAELVRKSQIQSLTIFKEELAKALKKIK